MVPVFLVRLFPWGYDRYACIVRDPISKRTRTRTCTGGHKLFLRRSLSGTSSTHNDKRESGVSSKRIWYLHIGRVRFELGFYSLIEWLIRIMSIIYESEGNVVYVHHACK
jgi:hypothetical protein